MIRVQHRYPFPFWILWLGLLGMAAACQRASTPKPPADYVKSIEESRQNKDKIFREDSESPIPAAARARFQGLAYFPVDPQFRIEAAVKRYDKEEKIEMLTSKGELQPYVRYAYVDLTVGGQPVRLTIYATQTKKGLHYFVPFKDKTNGMETYAAGRYLEVDIDRHWKTVVDFNQAYNPYCAYNHDYSCPIPPEENYLKIPIRAGERYIEPKS